MLQHKVYSSKKKVDPDNILLTFVIQLYLVHCSPKLAESKQQTNRIEQHIKIKLINLKETNKVLDTFRIRAYLCATEYGAYLCAVHAFLQQLV